MTAPDAIARDGQIAALILGASEYPLTSLNGTRAFLNSASGFRDYVASPDGLAVGDRLLDLFDSKESVLGQNKAIISFLKQQQDAGTLIVYYVGHGGFLPDKEYFLALQSTEKDSEYLTGLRIKAFAHTLDRHFQDRRIILILDCCFAGEAVDEFQAGELADVVDRQTCEAMPTRGTSLLVASSKDRPAVAPTGREFTMFSECLINVLTNGASFPKPILSLYDIGDAVQRLIKDRFRQAGVRPEVHSPRQEGGDPAKEEIFPNRAYRPPALPDLPKEIKEAMAGLLPGSRRDGVDALARLIKASGPEMAQVALENLHQIAETDDSKSVRDLAAKYLGELAQSRPPTVPRQPIAPVENNGPSDPITSPLPQETPGANLRDSDKAEPGPRPPDTVSTAPVHKLGLKGWARFFAIGFAVGLVGYITGAALWPIVEPHEDWNWSYSWTFFPMFAPGFSAAICILAFRFAAKWASWRKTLAVYFLASALVRMPIEGLLSLVFGQTSFDGFIQYYTPIYFSNTTPFGISWIVCDSVFFATISTYVARRHFQRHAVVSSGSRAG